METFVENLTMFCICISVLCLILCVAAYIADEIIPQSPRFISFSERLFKANLTDDDDDFNW